MATKTETLIQVLTSRLNAAEMRLDALQVDAVPVKAMVAQIAVIEHRLADLTKSHELWGQRGWAVLTVAASGFFSILGVTVGALLTFYLNAKK